MAFFKRRAMPAFFEWAHRIRNESGEADLDQKRLSHPAREVLEELQRWGASFFQDLVRLTGRLPIEVETGLWELVAEGLVSADGFANLRALIDPKQRLSGNRHPKRKFLRRQSLSQGRWTLLQQPGLATDQLAHKASSSDLEPLARQLLRRWGVMFRDLLSRETLAPPWRDLLVVYRRLEAQGQIRGGRFVSGFAGEQFALPEAVDALRTIRRSQPNGEVIRVSAADPLNLIGIVTPGERVRPHPETVLVFVDGVPEVRGAKSRVRT